jgi:hypothetical protein
MPTRIRIALALALLLGTSCNTSTQPRPTAQLPLPQTGKTSETASVVARPTIPPPKFRVYRSKLNEGTSVVVSPNTSDEQLKSLLWLFREKVRSHRFGDIGIAEPTSERWGKKGYLAGTISVYRGEKCAGENFSDTEGAPCGQGGHDAAVYEWGASNGEFNPDFDDAALESPDGNPTVVFTYRDQWQLPAELQAGLDAGKKAQEEKDKVQQLARKMFAEELQGRLRASGYDITVRAGDKLSEELALDSDIFKDTATRVEFLSSVLPKWRHDLCATGFRQVRLIRGGLFSAGDAYSVGCR